MNNGNIETKILPDRLLVTTQGIRGKEPKTTEQGICTMRAYKGFNRPENSICIDVFEGFGGYYKRRNNAKIDIQFSDGSQWNGTFEQLREIIFNKQKQ